MYSTAFAQRNNTYFLTVNIYEGHCIFITFLFLGLFYILHIHASELFENKNILQLESGFWSINDCTSNITW